ncbi:MAG: PLP-dependent aspartate aminotransferase family protein, partial [Firmicutes bacterium]|nr:PLP-dependent aspartate aminotransferase family protein [Bacillota bacterium]
MAHSPQFSWHLESLIAHVGVGSDPAYGSVSTPIYQTVTFQHPGEALGPFDYSRTENPTRKSLAQALARIENGAGAVLFSSGMAAIASLLHLLHAGDHIIVTEDSYGGTYRIIVDIFEKLGIQASFVDTRDLEKTAAAFTDHTRFVFIETPSNPILRITDIARLSTLCHTHHALLIVDNTFMTPVAQKPLDLGADVVVYSATKYLSGHNDVLAGAVITQSADLAEQIGAIANATGGILAPWDSWLVLRGLKTLALRMKQHQASAQKVAEFLKAHPAVKTIYYPGLTDHIGHTLQTQQASGFGGMLSFELLRTDMVIPFMNAL